MPIRAYVTFIHQEGQVRCTHHYNNEHVFKLLGDNPKIDRAPEPSDIIWENLEITPRKMMMAKIRYYFIHTLILGFSLGFFSFLKEEKNLIKNKYKDNYDCNSINNLFGDLKVL